ncbi:MT-A70-domain-containing protein [Schizophyllum commune]
MSVDDELRILVAAALHSLVNNKSIVLPMSSMDLLAHVITFKPPAGLFPPGAPYARLRLTDLRKFERILDTLTRTWDQGTVTIARNVEDGPLSVIDITLQTAGSSANATFTARKRKRQVDEEDDSAAGTDEEVEREEHTAVVQNQLSNVSKEMREAFTIILKGTARGRLVAEQFHSIDEKFEPICPNITKEECAKARAATTGTPSICSCAHFRPLIRPHTDPSLGHCSYLNTCYSEPTYAQSPSIPPFPGTAHSHGMAPPNSRVPTSLPSGLGAGGRGKEKAPCRYLHYELDWDVGDEREDHQHAARETQRKREVEKRKKMHRLELGLGPNGNNTEMLPPQWINCDLRRFDYSVLGKFHVIMADPPWDIHMSLPYGTMTDDEMKAMPIPRLQDEGILFLWVTGRAMEVGRECLRVWGYTRVDEIVWIKTNQLQRLIRTGRTGHWLNHTKEHLLVGVKNPADPSQPFRLPPWANRGLDTDVIVSEVRETSRKPDEVYGLIERMCPGGRKVEIFGRKHNVRPGWLTLGNQLGPDQVYEEELRERIRARYPDRLPETASMG